MKENYFKKKLLDALHGAGYWAKKIYPFGNAGMPDILAAKNGVFIGIELKNAQTRHAMEKGVSKIQWYKGDELLKTGNFFMIVAATKDRRFLCLIFLGPNVSEYYEIDSFDAFMEKFFKNGNYFKSYMIRRG